MSEPVVNDRAVSERAEALITAIHASLRVQRYHEGDNEASKAALTRVQEALSKLLQHHFEITLLLHDDQFYVNEVRVRPAAATFPLFEALAEHLATRGVGTIQFHAVPTSTELAALAELLCAEADDEDAKDAYARVVQGLRERSIAVVTLQPLVTEKARDLPVIEKADFVRQAYFRGIGAVRQLYEQAAARRPLAIKTAARVVQNFVDILTDPDDQAHHDMLILMTRVKNYRGYHANHAVNTAVLAVGFGHALGVERSALRELGTGAILADIGNSVLPAAMFRQIRKLDPAQIRAIREHPLRGVALVTGFQHLSDLVVAGAMGCAEHHRSGDRGYPPQLPAPKGLHAAIIQVCDRYDALCTARTHRPAALSTSDALTALVAQAGDGLEPAVVNAFLWWHTGLPGGEVIQMNTGELDLRATPPSMALRQTLVRLHEKLNRL